MEPTPRRVQILLDAGKVRRVGERLRARQSLLLGILGGLGAGLVAAFLWAVIVGMTGLQYELDWLPMIGLGFLVGVSVRACGRGMDRRFAFAAALIALVMGLLGSFFSTALATTGQGVGGNLGEILYRHGNAAIPLRLFLANWGWPDGLALTLTVIEAYFLARFRLAPSQIASLAPRGALPPC